MVRCASLHSLSTSSAHASQECLAHIHSSDHAQAVLLVHAVLTQHGPWPHVMLGSSPSANLFLGPCGCSGLALTLSGSFLAVPWPCSCPALALPWRCPGAALAMLWLCPASALALLRPSTSRALPCCTADCVDLVFQCPQLPFRFPV